MSGSVIPHDQRHSLMLDCVKRISDGESVRSVAQSIGISHTTLRIWMLDECPDEYKPAQRTCLIARIAEADTALDDADDQVSIARAREQCKFARWDAERRLPHLFGVKQEITTIKQTDDDSAKRLERLSNKLTDLLHGKRGDVTDV